MVDPSIRRKVGYNSAVISKKSQTGIKLVPSTSWTMNKQGARRVELVGLSNKRKLQQCFVGIFWEHFSQFN